MASSTNPVSSSTNLFRRLTFQSTIPLEISLGQGEPGHGSGCDKYYTHAPRYTYLPLLIPEIREHLVELALDDQQLADVDETQWWFEEVGSGSSGLESQGPCKWHWPLDLIHLYSIISTPLPSDLSTGGPSNPSPKPLRLILHLSNPPMDKLMAPNSIEICKTHWLNQIKEADFVKYRNTTKVTSMRKVDLEAGWEGLLQDDYDTYQRLASRLVPMPTPLPPPNRQGTEVPATAKGDSMYSVRGLPIKIYLPDTAPVIQDIIPPLGSEGLPTTMLSLLHTHLPLLFPPSSTDPYSLAVPLIQGVLIPPDSELAWLASCMCGVDGWVRIGIGLIRE